MRGRHRRPAFYAEAGAGLRGPDIIARRQQLNEGRVVGKIAEPVVGLERAADGYRAGNTSRRADRAVEELVAARDRHRDAGFSQLPDGFRPQIRLAGRGKGAASEAQIDRLRFASPQKSSAASAHAADRAVDPKKTIARRVRACRRRKDCRNG